MGFEWAERRQGRERVYRAIFVDDGGVISDNEERGRQWRRLLGEFFPPILGGTPERWSAANVRVMESFFGRYVQRILADRAANGRVTLDYATYYREYRLAWLRGMCEGVGVKTPGDDGAALNLADRAISYCAHRVRAPRPRAVDAIRALHARGYVLYTASGETRLELDGYLSALGVRELFTGLYGGDVVNTLKEGPEYYERILADSGKVAETSLFVDDNPIVLDWIRRAGARSALVSEDAPADARADHLAASLWELSQRL
jgi:HAD superfamily hydrolase (TIGR01509 family)